MKTEEFIVCAAICNPERFDLTGEPLIHCGLRHAFILWQGKYVSRMQAHQGFLTNKNRFVNRIEAMEIALNQKQVDYDKLQNPKIGLFSEDLY